MNKDAKLLAEAYETVGKKLVFEDVWDEDSIEIPPTLYNAIKKRENKLKAVISKLRTALNTIDELSSDYDSTDPYGGSLQSINRFVKETLTSVQHE